ncbi:BTAD domain-containing putative transcriptional regulator [Micromonospora sp. NBC_01796]|uniref:BTAD domain-containing putative transcriptional regulator n=1 Tax=Micromonospora sp. NBC_01796 TaxID=2975987 RepID=UPI002DD939F5|nr:BTAD domain-containing putative transcriptional regulator [Micromonospora sp. NBC_01796]WSA89760.1 winged helix-turn-helix domain-containing protein [Micromonospora sp. NBC_01796]
MGAGLRFELLGPLRAWHGDRELDLGPGKQRAVLAMLLLYAGRPVSPTQIVDAVWQDDPPMNGPNVVQKYVAGLRRILEPERSPRSPGQLLTLTDTGYQLRVSAENLDTELFERRVRRATAARTQGRLGEAADELRQALALWRGEPLVGFTGTFFDSARARLIEGRAAALESWAETELNLGRHKEMVTDLIQAVGRFPVREQLHGLLMLALYRSGRQAEALAAFREVRALLSEEYGVEPGESLQELHRRILRSDPALGVAGEPDRLVPPVLVAPAVPAPVAMPGAVPVASSEAVPVAMPGAVPVVTAAPASVLTAVPPTVIPAPVATPVPQAAQLPPAPPMPLPFQFAPVTGAQPSGHPGKLFGGWAETGFGLLVVIGSLGFMTWGIIAYYAGRRRSVWLGVTALVILILTGLFMTWGQGPLEEDLHVFDVVAVFYWGVISFGGVAFVLVMHWRSARSVGIPAAFMAAQRTRREQARHLFYHYPAARVDLQIGRPDLLRSFDDGGLIDVNAVIDQVLWSLPGITPEQGRHIAHERSQRGGFTSMDDFAARSRLPRGVLNQLREVLLFQPPITAAAPA